MAEFLTTHGTTARIEQIISKARERIVLISPYLRWSNILYERLIEADRRGISIVFVYGKEDLRADQQTLLDQLDHLSLYFCPNLHAKCYFNEQQMVISSLNLYEASERNREMGVAFSRNEAVYKDAEEEAQSILEASELQSGDPATLVHRPAPRIARQTSPTFGEDRRPTSRSRGRADAGGYCIRCRDRIPLDRESPLCQEDESIWAAFANWDYEEHFCHQCGAEVATSKARPLCERCFRGSF